MLRKAAYFTFHEHPSLVCEVIGRLDCYIDMVLLMIGFVRKMQD